jgi:hypothetical protein
MATKLSTFLATPDTGTAASHYYVETASDNFIRPKTLANVQAEIVTNAVLGTGTASATKFLRGDRVWTDTIDKIVIGGVGTSTLAPLDVSSISDSTLGKFQGYQTSAGIALQTLGTGSLNSGGVFVDARNENNAAVANMYVDINTDGSSAWSWTTQPAGARTDRRVERMRIDTSGQVIVQSFGQETAALTDAGNKGGSIYLRASAVGVGTGGAVLFGTTFGNGTPFAAIKGLVQDGANNTRGHLAFSTRNATTDTALTERLRIESGGAILQLNATSGSGAVVGEQTFQLTSNGSVTTQNVFADFFGATSSISLEASSTYEIKAYCVFLKTTAGTAVWQALASSAPTRMQGWFIGSPASGIGQATIATGTSGVTGSQASTTATFAATASLSTGVNHNVQITMVVQTNAATNFRLQLNTVTGTGTPLAGSYYTVKKISTTTGTFV